MALQTTKNAALLNYLIRFLEVLLTCTWAGYQRLEGESGCLITTPPQCYSVFVKKGKMCLGELKLLNNPVIWR